MKKVTKEEFGQGHTEDRIDHQLDEQFEHLVNESARLGLLTEVEAKSIVDNLR